MTEKKNPVVRIRAGADPVAAAISRWLATQPETTQRGYARLKERANVRRITGPAVDLHERVRASANDWPRENGVPVTRDLTALQMATLRAVARFDTNAKAGFAAALGLSPDDLAFLLNVVDPRPKAPHPERPSTPPNNTR